MVYPSSGLGGGEEKYQKSLEPCIVPESKRAIRDYEGHVNRLGGRHEKAPPGQDGTSRISMRRTTVMNGNTSHVSIHEFIRVFLKKNHSLLIFGGC